jgi:hypothetical protein
MSAESFAAWAISASALAAARFDSAASTASLADAGKDHKKGENAKTRAVKALPTLLLIFHHSCGGSWNVFLILVY